MELNLKQTIIQIVIPTVIIAIVFVVFSLLPSSFSFIHPHKWALLTFFVFTSLLTSTIAHYGIGKENLQVYYFTSILVRMFAAIILIFIYIFLEVSQLYLFIANFFVLYFFFMAFEIYFLLVNLQTNSKTI